ncbi:unnamed protein product [Cochlearia groenlandica]
MPSGSKKRKAAKRKQQQASSTSTTNLKSNKHATESRSQGERESNDGVVNYKKDGFTEEDSLRIEKEPDFDTYELIEITDSSHDHDNSSSSSRSSDDESREVTVNDGDCKETGDYVSQVITVSSAPDQPYPLAGDAPFIGSTANVIVENSSVMDSTTHSDQNTDKIIEILHVDTLISENVDENSWSKPNQIIAKAAESKCVSEDSRESEVVVYHEEPVIFNVLKYLIWYIILCC